jgi:hypothetical protein
MARVSGGEIFARVAQPGAIRAAGSSSRVRA